MHKVKRSMSDRFADLKSRFGDKSAAARTAATRDDTAVAAGDNNKKPAVGLKHSVEFTCTSDEVLTDSGLKGEEGAGSMADQADATSSAGAAARCCTLPRGFRYGNTLMASSGDGATSKAVTNESEAVEVLTRSSFRKHSDHTPRWSKTATNDENSLTREDLVQRRANINQQLQAVLSSANERSARRRLFGGDQDTKQMTDDAPTTSSSVAASDDARISIATEKQQTNFSYINKPAVMHYACEESSTTETADTTSGKTDPNQYVSMIEQLPPIKCLVGVQQSETYLSAVCSSGYHPTMSLRARRWAYNTKQLTNMRDGVPATATTDNSSERQRAPSLTLTDRRERNYSVKFHSPQGSLVSATSGSNYVTDSDKEDALR
jgi:hypothetical protein